MAIGWTGLRAERDVMTESSFCKVLGKVLQSFLGKLGGERSRAVRSSRGV